jgi:SAM-dependent methyltransferase
MSTDSIATPVDLDDVVQWGDAHRYSPAPRHRRRLIRRWVDRLVFAEVLDAGCAQPFLLQEILARRAVAGFGCDLSEAVIDANRSILQECQFRALDLTAETWPDDRRFDLVICSEVLEHVADWPAAVANLVRMTRKHLLITVPSGPLRAMDQRVGHLQHFRGPELVAELKRHGCPVVRQRYWGWPLHSLYKAAISTFSPATLYDAFSGGKPYGPGKRLISDLLFGLFFINDCTNQGNQLVILARIPRRTTGAG